MSRPFCTQIIILVEFPVLANYKNLNENGLDETFSEVSKLLEIVLVTPISITDSERSLAQ